MENQTDSNQTYFNFRLDVWYGNVISNGLLGVISLYLVVALIFFEIKIEKPRKQRFLKLSLENKLAVLSKFTCIAIGVASVICQWSAFGGMFFGYEVALGNHTDGLINGLEIKTICETFSRLGNIALTLGSGLVYLFLWFRQRVFYIHPSLKVLNNKLVRVFSNSIMVAWFLYYFSLYFCYFILVHYHYKKQGGCLVTESSYDSYSSLIVSWTVISILMQIILLGLFIYPILKRASREGHQGTDRNFTLMKRVKKAVILASICLATDLLSIGATSILFLKNSNGVFFAFSTNLVINHFVTIVCFDHWKKLLWPWNLQSDGESCQYKGKSDAIISMSTMSTKDHSNHAINGPAAVKPYNLPF